MKTIFRTAAMVAVILVSALTAQAQSVSLEVSALSGDPGDIITFDWSYDLGGETKDRYEIKFDGYQYPGATGGTSGSYKWTATPGSHTFRVYVRTKDADGNKTYKQTLKTVFISGWETDRFVHPGLNLSEAEIDKIRENIKSTAIPCRRRGL